MSYSKNLNEILSKSISKFNIREQKILMFRILADEKSKLTLQILANKYRLTRERVNQIEKKIVDLIYKDICSSTEIEEIFIKIVTKIENHSGILYFDDLLKYLVNLIKNKKKSLLLIRILISKKMLQKQKFQNKIILTPDNLNFISFVNVNKYAESVLLKNQNGKKINDLYNNYKDKNLLSLKQFKDYISLDKNINKKENIYYHKRSGIYSPKTYADYLHLILCDIEKPLHFRELTKIVKKQFNIKQKISSQNIHNALRNDSRFVWVGRGIYALKEWGFERKSTKKIVEDFLREKERPMKIRDIVDYVQDHRLVNKQTVNLSLSDKNIFTQIRKGVYALKEWGYIPTLYTHEKYQKKLKGVLREILINEKEPLSIMEIQDRIQNKYKNECSSNKSSIYCLLSFDNQFKKNLYGKYYLSIGENYEKKF